MAELRDRLQTALGDAYRIERELGGGGMSRVFLAEEVRLGRQVVIKVLPPEMAAGVNVERFEREIRLAAKLQHPHIVPLLTAGSEGDLLYYIMPHIAGESLRARLTHERELPVGEAVRILRDVCDALAYAHSHGIVHRDVKPDNVLFSGRHALVTDFGVAKAVADSTGTGALTSMGMALGTPAYMAPEQAAGDPNVDHRADLYAVGVLAYEMLTGRPPFIGLSPQSLLAAQVTGAVEPVTKHRENVPPALSALVMRCLAKRPADRWQSATEILDQLEQLATPTASSPYDPIAAATRGHPVRVAGLFALGSLVLLGVVYFLMTQLGLPGWVMGAAIALLAVGLPLMVTTGLLERRRALAGGLAPAGGNHWLTWRRAFLSGAAGFGLLGLGTAGYMAMRLLGIGPVGTLVASGVLAQRDRLVLAGFENRTQDSTLGTSLTEALRVDLAQSPAIRLLDAAALSQALGRMGRNPDASFDRAVAQELAQREGAKAVVRGQIDPVGRGYVLSAELVSAADGATLVSLRENAKDDGAIIDAVDRLSKRLRERIGESLKTIRASDPLEQVTTGSLAALRRYSQALRANDAGESDRAVALLGEAIALDTTFAMAYRKLAVVLNNTGQAPSRIADAATSAFRHRDRLTPLERDLAEAFYYYQADFDRAKVESGYRSALELDPENYMALNNLALALNTQRKFAQAESLTQRPAVRGARPHQPHGLHVARAAVGLAPRLRQCRSGHPGTGAVRTGRGVAGADGVHPVPAEPGRGQARRGGAPRPRGDGVCRESRPIRRVCRRLGVARHDQCARSQCARDSAAPGGRCAAPPPPRLAARHRPAVPQPRVVLCRGRAARAGAPAARRVRRAGSRGVSAARAVPARRGGRRRARGGAGSGRDQGIPRLVRRGLVRGVRIVRAGARLRAGRPARFGDRRLRARGHDSRHAPHVRGSRHPGADLQAARRLVRGARAARQGARLLRPIPGLMEECGSGAAAAGARGEAATGETECRRVEIAPAPTSRG